MNAQQSTLGPRAGSGNARSTNSHWPKLPAWMTGAAPETDLTVIRTHADSLCALVSIACLMFAVLQGLAYNNIAEALAWGIPLCAGSLAIGKLYGGQTATMALNAVLLAGMGALHVHLGRGLPEFHFSFFMLLPVLLAYRDVRPLLTMGIAIVLHHLVFDQLQQAGFNCYVFRGPFAGLPAVALHGFYVAVEVFLLCVIAQTLRHHALAAQESATLLACLDKEKGINLLTRAQPDEHGKMSAMGRVFNDYADNMAFVVAAFKMLRIDIRELSQIARELGAENSQQLDENSQAAKKLRDFVQNLGTQTRMGQGTAELARKITEDCFDLLNELNQSVEQLQKIGKLAFESNQQIQLVHKESQGKAPAVVTQQLQIALSTLDHLNERTQSFMAKMDLLRSGLSAIENQIVSIDHATHNWVENGHGNQRQGWEVLGAMESMQTHTEAAFQTLDNTVQTILRSDELIREMEKRLARFHV